MSKRFELRDRVFSILEKYPETRNCDATLVARYWECFDSISLSSMPRIKTADEVVIGYDLVLPLRNLKYMQPASSIERMRRHIQNEMGRFWPTDPKVARRRRMNMDKWKERMVELKPDTL